MRERLRGEYDRDAMRNQIAEGISAQADICTRATLLWPLKKKRDRFWGSYRLGGFRDAGATYSQDSSTRDLVGIWGFFPEGVLTSREVEAVAFSLSRADQ